MAKKKIFLVCTGLGRINRGYESFSRECFDVLKDAEAFDMYLIKGGGESKDKEITLPNLHRKGKLTNWVGNIFKVNGYIVEQVTFLLSLLPLIITKKPALIYYSDFKTGTYLWHLREKLKLKYRLLFANGAPNGPPYKTEDHVQQLLPSYYKQAVEAGAPAQMQTLLPYGFNLGNKFYELSAEQKFAIRKQFDIPANKKVIISIGAINAGHKRMDYVIGEFARLTHDEYFLILLGQIDENSAEVMNLASQSLPVGSYTIREVKSVDVPRYLSIADYFILASLIEGFGRVLIEALQFGLMPIVHNYAIAEEVLGKCGIYGDLTKHDVLQQLINEVDAADISKEEIWSYGYNTYSWEALKQRYINMIVNNI